MLIKNKPGMNREDGVASAAGSDANTSLEDSQPGPLRGCFLCLLSFFLSVVMTTKKKSSGTKKAAPVPAPDHRKAKRPRSVSMSVELECPGRQTRSKTKSFVSQTHSLEAHWKPSSIYLEGFLPKRPMSSSSWQAVEGIAEGSSAYCSQYQSLLLNNLPIDCKLKIFSFLTARERGIAAQVCSEWSTLMKKSSLWSTVDLTGFPLCYVKRNAHRCGQQCYLGYRDRVKKFMSHLQTIKPALRNFSFSFDIGDYEDGWLDSLESLLKCSRLLELKMAHINWKETPVKPLCSESVTWSSADYHEMQHRHRYRQRRFVRFIEMFTAAAPNIKKLSLPCDWSEKTLKAIGHLQHLHSLVLEKYSVFQPFEQSSLDQLLLGCPSLRSLVLEVYTPSGRGLQLYRVSSDNLTYLDVSQCRGVYIRQVKLPAVRVFKISRHPWNGPLVSADRVDVPCILEVLREGAPSLTQINEHTLKPDWREIQYEELETVMKAVCSCRQHKTGWLM